MHEGYSNRFVCQSVTMLAATYLIYTSKIQCHRVLHGVFKDCAIWLSLKTLCSHSFVKKIDNTFMIVTDFPKIDNR